jgi:hypothetical protein
VFSSENLKTNMRFMFMSAEVAQTGRAPDSIEFIEGEAEDRAVAGSSPALGTTMLFEYKPKAF